MADNETKNSNDGGGEGGASKPSKKKSEKRKRKQQLQPGDPGYKTPTQLRNARKRRKQKEDKTSASSASGTGAIETGGDVTKFSNSNNDPSLKYLSNPKAAPTVRYAIKFFREKTNAEAGTNIDAYFPVTVGPKLGWRTVARLAVRVRSSKNNSNSDDKKCLRIGLFVPGSHELLPVPDCPVHHRKINGLVKILEETCNNLEVPALDDDAEGGARESTDNFGLRYVAIAVERTSQKLQLVLVWKEPPSEVKNNNSNILDSLVQNLVRLSRDKTKKDILLHSVWVHYNNAWKHSNSIFDREGRWETKFVDGENNDNSTAITSTNQSNDDPLVGAIRETMLPITTNAGKNSTDNSRNNTRNKIHVPLYFPPQVFRQANLDGFAKIIQRIREWLHEQQLKEPASSSSSSSFDSQRVIEDALPPKRKRRRGNRDTSNTSHNKQEQEQQQQQEATSDGRTRSLGHCLELYGGVGTIGLNLVDYFDSLDSSDENPFNEACFHASADNIKILRGENHEDLDPSKRAKITYTSKSASAIVVEQYESLKKARVVVVDPPRKGLDPPVIEALCSDYGDCHHQQQGLVYVSCGFDAFRRDYRALVEHSGKWQLDRAEGHILFPGSDAIETLAFFTRTK